MIKSIPWSLIAGTIAALVVACSVVAPAAEARRTVINMQRVKGKSKARAWNKCNQLDQEGWECLYKSPAAVDCRRQSLQRPDIGWCWSQFVVRSHFAGASHGKYYLFNALTWGQSINNKIRWKLLGWSAMQLPDA